MSEVTARGKGDHPWVQPIFVVKTGSHEDTVAAGAVASLRARFVAGVSSEVENQFQQWLSGPFTKTVRRASPEQLQKVVQWAQENTVPSAAVQLGSASALALPPMTYAAMPKVMARLQVSGTDFERSEVRVPVDPLLRLYVWDQLSTGKATAQAAHGLWSYHLAHEGELNEAVLETSNFLDLNFVTADALMELSLHPHACSIRDNGLTEVAAQTLTAVGLPL